MLLLSLLARPPFAAVMALAIDLPLDASTIIVLVVALGFPLLIWWANRPSVIERYSRPEREAGEEDSPAAGVSPASPLPGADPARRGE